MMNPYLGTRIVLAEEATNQEFENSMNGDKAQVLEADKIAPGYSVAYPDGYRNWYPKETFEFLYRSFSVGEVKFFKAGEEAQAAAEKVMEKDVSADNLKVVEDGEV